jgi:signal transduction histidine kinase
MLDIVDINLREEIERYIKNQQLLYDKKNITIENKVKENIVVKADKLYLEEVFDNLLSNALKFTQENGMISIDAEKYNDVITISVKDNGIGINKNQLGNIFKEFFKVDESRHDLDSSGLGLSICKRIVEKHGGRIWAESSGLKKGSTFYFTIPSSSKINGMNISEIVDKELKKLGKKNSEFY